jgi:hypothetical protein
MSIVFCSVLYIRKYFVTCQHWSDIRKHNSSSLKEISTDQLENRVFVRGRGEALPPPPLSIASIWIDDVNGLIFVNISIYQYIRDESGGRGRVEVRGRGYDRGGHFPRGRGRPWRRWWSSANPRHAAFKVSWIQAL